MFHGEPSQLVGGEKERRKEGRKDYYYQQQPPLSGLSSYDDARVIIKSS